MAADNLDSPRMVTLSVTGIGAEGVRSETTIRNFPPVVMDEPPGLGGQDAGPNPMEFVLASLVGCFSVMIRIIAAEMSFSYTTSRFELQGELDVRGLMGVPGVRADFSMVSGRVILDTPEPSDRIAELRETVEARCPVCSMLRNANTRIEIAWVSA